MADREAGVVIVGAGAAGSACAETLARDRGFSGSILLVGRDSDPPYERPHASKSYLRGETDRDAATSHAMYEPPTRTTREASSTSARIESALPSARR